MKIDLYSVMYNEERLLPYFLRHYEKFVNRIFVWDDNSTDNTRNILAAHEKVTLIPMDVHGDNDIYWISALFPQYETLSRGLADWVIISDADEFVYHPDMLQVLSEEKAKGTEIILCKGFTMISDKFPDGEGQIYDEIKLGISDALESKWTVFSPDIFVRFKKGRHGRPIRRRSGNANRASGIKLLHYRYMGKEYFEERDIRNVERMEYAFNQGIIYDPRRRRNLPDKTRGVPLDWYAKHKDEAINVVNYD